MDSKVKYFLASVLAIALSVWGGIDTGLLSSNITVKNPDRGLEYRAY